MKNLQKRNFKGFFSRGSVHFSRVYQAILLFQGMVHRCGSLGSRAVVKQQYLPKDPVPLQHWHMAIFNHSVAEPDRDVGNCLVFKSKYRRIQKADDS